MGEAASIVSALQEEIPTKDWRMEVSRRLPTPATGRFTTDHPITLALTCLSSFFPVTNSSLLHLFVFIVSAFDRRHS
jgi:hypothetical protein